MKKYVPCAVKWLALLAVISVIVLSAGIISIIIGSSNIRLQIGLTMFGGLMTILFLSCFFAEKNRYLTIEDEKIVLPRGVDKNEKVTFNRTIINTKEIRSIMSELCKGDGIIQKDTCFYTLILNDGTRIKFTLYAYGNDAEDEILEAIKKCITSYTS